MFILENFAKSSVFLKLNMFELVLCLLNYPISKEPRRVLANGNHA